MSKHLITAIVLFVNSLVYAQTNNEKYFYKPFPIYKCRGEVVIAGDLNSFVYSNYFGSDVKKEGYTDPHSKPEFLVYELFKNMKNRDIPGINRLYDFSFNKDLFDPHQMAAMLANYSDIKFISKFRSGNLMIIRYDFISSGKQYASFAAIKNIQGKYYLTMDLNISDPFNLVGSSSPYNLFERKEETLNVKNMTPFYFIGMEKKIFFSNDMPQQDYSVVYFSFDFFNKKEYSPEFDFIAQLQKAARSADPAQLTNMVAKDNLSLLSDSYFSNHFYYEIKKIFQEYSAITPLAAIKTDKGKIIYLKYSNPGQSENITSIIINQSDYGYKLAFQIKNDDVNSILQNVYVKEALYDYFKQNF